MEETEHGQRSEGDEGRNALESRRSLTREELYDLVWKVPMSRLAGRFGLSDVGLRKICVKNDVPTPSLGYWAKLAHGKRVVKPSLPPCRNARSNTIALTLQSSPSLPPAVAAAQADALLREAGKTPITAPTERPTKLHAVATAASRAVRAATADSAGIKHVKLAGTVELSIGAASLNRVLCIVDAFARAAEQRGHKIDEHKEGIQIVVDGVPFVWSICEAKDRSPHQPTKEELKAQTQHDEYRARYPGIYSSRQDYKVYRSWDYFPSGRLAMTFADTTCSYWDRMRTIGTWRDRKNRRLEEYLSEAMASLATAAVRIKHRLAEEAERARRRAEELERQRREQARQDRAVKRQRFLLKKARDFHRYQRLEALAAHLRTRGRQSEHTEVARLIEELHSIVEAMRNNFEREVLQVEVARMGLFTAEDLVGSPSSA